MLYIQSNLQIDQTIFLAHLMEPKTTSQKTFSDHNPQQATSAEVIQLISSDEQPNPSSDTQHDLQIIQKDPNNTNSKPYSNKNYNLSKHQNIQKKPKKTTSKCYICKNNRPKQQSQRCTQCNQSYHLNCLSARKGNLLNNLLCENCDSGPNLRVSSGQISKKIAIQNKRCQKQKNRQTKLTLNFRQKSSQEILAKKQKQINTAVLQSFKERYPFYVDKSSKIIFPIDDKLLLIYKQLFEVKQELPAPSDFGTIQPVHLGDMLIIQNFCLTFEKQMNFGFNCQKQIIYDSFKSHRCDICFKSLLTSLLNLYLGDIFLKNKTQNLKTINGDSFYQLVRYLRQNLDVKQFLPQIWRELISKLEKVPTMSKAFETLNKSVDTATLTGKIHLLKQIIMGLSQVNTFHDMIHKKTQKNQEIIKQKGESTLGLKSHQAQVIKLTQIIKKNQARIKIIQKQISTSQNKEQTLILQRQLQEVKLNNGTIKQQILRHKQNVIVLKQKKDETNRLTAFITGEIQLLGRDRNQSEYYLSYKSPEKIYINYKKSLISSKQCFKILSGRASITNYIKFFDIRGTKQKQLQEIIQSHLKSEVIFDVEKKDLQGQVSQSAISYYQEEFQLTGLDVQKIILECDNSFSNYLQTKNCRWLNLTNKESFKNIIRMNINNIDVLKHSLKFMHQKFSCVEHFGENQQSNEAKSQEISLQKEECFKKKRILIWGVYFQKIRKCWIQQLDLAASIESIWICSKVFQHFVEKYIKKKTSRAKQKQRKLQKVLQSKIYMDEEISSQKQQNQKHKKSEIQKQDSNYYQEQQKIRKSQKLVVKGKLVRKSQVKGGYMNKKQYSSRAQKKYLSAQYAQEESQSHHKSCQMCGESGEVICCNSCEKVFHIKCLGIKKIPEDQWTCLKCLQRISNFIQTRNKTRELYLQ